MKWVVVLLLAAQCLQSALAARILALCLVASHSHSLWCYSYMAALAERGHQITVLGVDEPKMKIANLTKFIVPGVYEAAFGIPDGFLTDSKFKVMYAGLRYWDEMSSKVILHSKELQDLIKQNKNVKKPFDLIIHDDVNAEALLGLVPLFGNPPLLLATTYGSPQWMTSRVGNILNPAYVPSMVSSSDSQMTFYERCVNTAHYVFLEWYARGLVSPFQDRLMREVFGNHLPYVRDIAKRANIVIVNTHFAMNEPRPLFPGVVPIAGLHVLEPHPLPKDIKDFMDGAEHGVILFSFGSNVASNWLPQGIETVILEALRQLPQRVLWKWERMLPHTPPNVKISPWLPQGDILEHPKIRLFVSHCGLLSSQEAIFRKVPILAVPVFLDQLDIAAMLVRRNITIQLDLHTMTTDQLRDSIKKVLLTPMFKENIEKLGELMKDMPHTSKQRAVFWTEYAIRHKGAPHLRSVAADMPLHQLFLVDVLGFALLLLLVTVWLIKVVIFSVFRRVTSSKLKTKAE